MQARGDSHADDSHAAAATRIGLSCAVAGSCTGRRSLCRRILCGRVVHTGRGHEHRLSNGRGKQADRLRRGRALGEHGTREELEGRSEGKVSVHILRGCGQYPTPMTHAFGSGAAAALPALPAVLFEAPACGAAAAGAASGAVLFDAPAAAAGAPVALAAAVTVSFIVLVTVAAALPFPFPFPFPPSSAPKSANSPPPPAAFPFPPLASMPSLLTRRISWEKPLACDKSSALPNPEKPPPCRVDAR